MITLQERSYTLSTVVVWHKKRGCSLLSLCYRSYDMSAAHIVRRPHSSEFNGCHRHSNWYISRYSSADGGRLTPTRACLWHARQLAMVAPKLPRELLRELMSTYITRGAWLVAFLQCRAEGKLILRKIHSTNYKSLLLLCTVLCCTDYGS